MSSAPVSPLPLPALVADIALTTRDQEVAHTIFQITTTVVVLAVVYALWHWRQHKSATPLLDAASMGFAGLPSAIVINSDVPNVTVQAAGIATILIALAVVRATTMLLASRSRFVAAGLAAAPGYRSPTRSAPI